MSLVPNFHGFTGSFRPFLKSGSWLFRPVIWGFFTTQVQRFVETANIFAALRDIIGGNALTIIISADANDTAQLKTQMRFQIATLVIYAEVLGIPAIAALYKHEIDRDTDLKHFFTQIIGRRYLECAEHYGNLSPSETPDSTIDTALGLLNTGKSVSQDLIQLVQDLAGILILSVINAFITSALSTTLNPRPLGTTQSYSQTNYASRIALSPEIVMGYSNWKQILNTTLYASLLGETMYKMFTNIKLSPIAWRILNPLIDVYWTFLKTNIQYSMRFNQYITQGQLITTPRRPFYGTDEENITQKVTSQGNFPSIFAADVITHQLAKTGRIETSDPYNQLDDILCETGSSKTNIHSTVTIIPCCEYVKSGEAGDIQAFCSGKKLNISPDLATFMGLNPDLIDTSTEQQDQNPASGTSLGTGLNLHELSQYERSKSGLYVFDDIISEDTQTKPGTTHIGDLWERVVEIYITQETLNEEPSPEPPLIASFSLASNHSIEFRVTLSNESTADTALVTLYNINPKTLSKIIATKSRILIKAGYTDNFSTIFEGFVTDRYETRIGADTATTIIAFNDIFKLQSAPAAPYTAVQGVPYDQVIAELMGQCGIPIGVIQVDSNVTFGETHTLPGNAYMNLQLIAQGLTQEELDAADWYTDQESYTFYLKDSIGYFVKRKYVSQDKVYLGSKLPDGSHGGLLSATKAENPDDMIKGTAISLLNHRLKTDTMISIDSITLGKGDYKSSEVVHTCTQKEYTSTIKLALY